MTNDLKIPEYFYREYAHDLQSQPKQAYLSKAVRLTAVALPFISLYRPIEKPLAASMGLIRAFTSLSQGDNHPSLKVAINTSLAIASVIGTIFLHPVGILMTSGHDIGLNTYELYGAIQKGNSAEATEKMIHLANNTFYFLVILTGSVELQIASLTVQVLVGTFSAAKEFKKGNWLESAGHLAMTAIRANQFVSQVHMFKSKYTVEKLEREVENVAESKPSLNHSTEPGMQNINKSHNIAMVALGSVGSVSPSDDNLPYTGRIDEFILGPNYVHIHWEKEQYIYRFWNWEAAYATIIKDQWALGDRIHNVFLGSFRTGYHGRDQTLKFEFKNIDKNSSVRWEDTL